MNTETLHVFAHYEGVIPHGSGNGLGRAVQIGLPQIGPVRSPTGIGSVTGRAPLGGEESSSEIRIAGREQHSLSGTGFGTLPDEGAQVGEVTLLETRR